MAQSDRKLTLVEVLNGNISEEYLDYKEKKAIIERHIYRLADKRIKIEDKISIIGEKKELLDEHKKICDKISKLVSEIENLNCK